MTAQTKIIYSGFWDRPLGFVAAFDDLLFFFSREFDDDFDDYPAEYQVFLLPEITEEEIQHVWQDLRQRATAYLGAIPMNQVIFDQSFRQSIESDILANFARKLRIQ